mmetsp:Transcript_13172/g.19881  ORF Transcript_13172/g.19881 Transcript_13172/m.19881 type:complete len:309 (+) Transcript_13172:1657-2583(+)
MFSPPKNQSNERSSTILESDLDFRRTLEAADEILAKSAEQRRSNALLTESPSDKLKYFLQKHEAQHEAKTKIHQILKAKTALKNNPLMDLSDTLSNVSMSSSGQEDNETITTSAIIKKEVVVEEEEEEEGEASDVNDVSSPKIPSFHTSDLRLKEDIGSESDDLQYNLSGNTTSSSDLPSSTMEFLNSPPPPTKHSGVEESLTDLPTTEASTADLAAFELDDDAYDMISENMPSTPLLSSTGSDNSSQLAELEQLLRDQHQQLVASGILSDEDNTFDAFLDVDSDEDTNMDSDLDSILAERSLDDEDQ